MLLAGEGLIKSHSKRGEMCTVEKQGVHRIIGVGAQCERSRVAMCEGLEVKCTILNTE